MPPTRCYLRIEPLTIAVIATAHGWGLLGATLTLRYVLLGSAPAACLPTSLTGHYRTLRIKAAKARLSRPGVCFQWGLGADLEATGGKF